MEDGLLLKKENIDKMYVIDIPTFITDCFKAVISHASPFRVCPLQCRARRIDLFSKDVTISCVSLADLSGHEQVLMNAGPARSAYDLKKAWPDMDLRFIPDAGHSAREEGIKAMLVQVG